MSEETFEYVDGIEYSKALENLHPRNCAVIVRTGDGVSVGPCWHYLGDGITCPQHGVVRHRTTPENHNGI